MLGHVGSQAGDHRRRRLSRRRRAFHFIEFDRRVFASARRKHRNRASRFAASVDGSALQQSRQLSDFW